MKRQFLLTLSFLFSIYTISQNVGIGTTLPQSKLHIVDGSSGYSGSYFPGITLEGVHNRYLNIITPSIRESGVLFGNNTDAASGGIVYNNSTTINGLQFRTNGNITRMVLSNSGFLGIGNSNPAYVLDVNGRMRIAGSNPNDAGIWLSNSTAQRAFIGLENDNYVGFYGEAGAGWKFGMNVQTGALRIDGSEGSAGQVLGSTGGSADKWVNGINYIYNNTFEFSQTINTTTSLYDSIRGLKQTINLQKNSKVLISLDANVTSTGCFACGSQQAFLAISINNFLPLNSLAESKIPNGEFVHLSTGFKVFNLSAGSYTVFGAVVNPTVDTRQITAWGGRMVIIILPSE